MSEAKQQSTKGDTFSGREKQKDIRSSNLVAAKAVATVLRTSLGPRGMDKMITSSKGEVVITNDGATILNKMEVVHPAAQMFVDLSKAQDVEAGDGTTSVVILAGSFVDKAQELLEKGLHPSVIADAWLQASFEAEKILKTIATPINLSQRDALIRSAITSLNSKVVSQNSNILAPIAVDAVLRVIDPKTATNVDLNDIRVVKNIGENMDDTELVDGIVFTQKANTTAGGPPVVENAKIALIQFCLSAPKTDMDNQVIVSDYQQMDRILKEERKYILNMIKVIVKSNCKLLLIQKSILRDAVNDLALHYLSKYKIMVITDIERNEVEFVAKTLGCTPIAHIDHFSADKLGEAKLVEQLSTPGGALVKVTGVKNPGKTVSVIVRGSNKLVLDEAERSLHDALCVVRSLVKLQYMIAGGGAPEVELSLRLADYAERIGGKVGYCIRGYADALEVIPYALAENAGLNPVTIVTELRKQHAAGVKNAGINMRLANVSDVAKENVLQPLLVTSSALKLATECVRMMLKIDDIVAVR